nr:MAG TPA: hypothetical protein [Bacteriophage sp.]
MLKESRQLLAWSGSYRPCHEGLLYGLHRSGRLPSF